MLTQKEAEILIPMKRKPFRLSPLHDLMPRGMDLMFLLLGALIQAVGICNIHARSSVTEGGVLGLTLLLYHWTGLSPALSSLVLNGACYLYGIRRLGKPFLVRSALASAAYAVFYALLDPFAPLFPSLLASPFLCAVFGALFIGAGAGLCVLAGGATAGDDALAMGLVHRFGCDIRVVYLVSDSVVLLLSLSYIPIGRIAWSLLTVLLSGQIIGLIQKAGHRKA